MSDAPTFRGEPLVEILAYVRARLAAGAGEIAFAVIDPDLGRGRYAGEEIEVGGARYRHRPLRVWVDLAERLGLRLATPRVDGPLMRLRFERLAEARRWRAGDDGGDGGGDDGGDGGDGGGGVPDGSGGGGARERYGAESEFARVDKAEEPGFVLDLEEAVQRARLPRGARVLDLGVNDGDELVLLDGMLDGATFVGVDHSASALARARGRLPAERARWIEGDLNALGALGLGRFDLVVSLNTLHSPCIDDREVLRRIVQDHLEPDGAVIVGFPSSRYRGGELEYGARMRNYRQPELGLLIKDVAFYRKYLQQHRRHVYVTGKYYVLVTGVAAGGGAAPSSV